MKALATAAFLLGAAAGGLYLRHQQVADSMSELIRRLRSLPLASSAEPLEARLKPLPPPVARYLRLALGDQQVPPRWVHLERSGRLRTATTSTRWLDFIATHNASPSGCAFA